MKHIRKHLRTVLMVSALSLLFLTACNSSPNTDILTAPGAEGEIAIPETIRPIELGVRAKDSFSFPMMGMTITLPQALQDAINQEQSIYMDTSEASNKNGTGIRYAFLSWHSVTEEQRNAEIDYALAPFQQWLSSLTQIGSIGVFARDQADQLDMLTGSDTHQLLGESPDGAYQYYLSTNSAAPEVDRKLVSSVHAKIKEMSEYLPDISAFKQSGGNLGSFTMQDLSGTTYTQEMFSKNKLTMVNVFATWCSPCVREIPELEELHLSMADQGVGVIGIVLDTIGPDGQPDKTAIKTAQKLAERTSATYPFLIPDATAMNGRLLGISAVPETFFVDNQGNIVGSVYPGARDLDSWMEIVEKELSRLGVTE